MIADVVVSGPDGGVPAYLRFAPAGAPDAVVEAFSDTKGHAVTRLVAGTHIGPRRASGRRRRAAPDRRLDVVDVDRSRSTPARRSPAWFAIRRTRCWRARRSRSWSMGSPSTRGDDRRGRQLRAARGGKRRRPSPSRSRHPTRAACRGCRRRRRCSPWTCRCRSATRATSRSSDLAGTVVRRLGAPVAGAGVTVVGALDAVGTVGPVTSGALPIATGDIRVSATTDGAGALPAMLVPSAATLSAVITVAAGDLAVVALDTSGGVPATLGAPPMQPIAAAVFDPGTTRLSGAVLDLVPIGALAMAGAPVLHVTADSTGAVTAALPSGGHYDLRFRDPLGRGALLVDADRTATTVATSYHLAAALQVRGTVKLGGTQPLTDASIQLLCADLHRDRACTADRRGGDRRRRPVHARGSGSGNPVGSQMGVAVKRLLDRRRGCGPGVGPGAGVPDHRRATIARWLVWVLAAGCVTGSRRPRAPSRRRKATRSRCCRSTPTRSLEIYGQPVASEIARALVAGERRGRRRRPEDGGARARAADRRRHDRAGQGRAPSRSRCAIRNRLDGTVLDTLSATAPGLAKIDGAAAELSARVLPIVHDQARGAAPAVDRRPRRTAASSQTPRSRRPTASCWSRSPIATPRAARCAAARGARRRGRRRGRARTIASPASSSRRKLDPKLATKAVAAGAAELAIGVRGSSTTRPRPARPPMARARVRVRIADAQRDRVRSRGRHRHRASATRARRRPSSPRGSRARCSRSCARTCERAVPTW